MPHFESIKWALIKAAQHPRGEPVAAYHAALAEVEALCVGGGAKARQKELMSLLAKYECIHPANLQGIGADRSFRLVSALGRNGLKMAAREGKLDILSTDEAAAYWEELSCNKGGVDWEHWLALPVLKTSEAAHLLYGVDPDEKRQRQEAEKKREAITKLIRLAECKPPADKTPRGWHSWALQNGVEPFLNYTKNLPDRDVLEADKARNGTIADEKRCVEWLVSLMRNNSTPEFSKRHYLDKAVSDYKLSERASLRAWGSAIREAENPHWSRPGRKTKKS